MTNEVKIGIIGFVALFAVLFTFNYLNRQNVFSRNLIISGQFDDLNFIRKGNAVYIKGREVGEVVDIYPKGEYLMVDMDIDPSTRMPSDAVAVITELSLMGGHMVDLRYDKPCLEGCLVSGDVIKGQVSDLRSRIAAQAEPILKGVGNLADSLGGPNGVERTLDRAYASLARLNKTTARITGNIRRANIPATARNFRQLSGALLNGNGTLPDNLKSTRELAMSLDTLVHSLASMTDADIDTLVQIIYTTQEMTAKVPVQTQRLEGLLVSTNQQLDNLSYSLKGYQKGAKGIVPQLLYDEAMRDDAQAEVKRLSKLLEDIRNHPEKYLDL